MRRILFFILLLSLSCQLTTVSGQQSLCSEDTIVNVVEELKKYKNWKEVKAAIDNSYNKFAASKSPEEYEEAKKDYIKALPELQDYFRKNRKEDKTSTLLQSIRDEVKPSRKQAQARSDCSPMNCSLSESCFNDIIGLVECIINETKKANKEAHQEIIFKKLNPEGAFVEFHNYAGHPYLEEIKNRMTNVKTKFPPYSVSGNVQSMKDFRGATSSDNPDSGWANRVRELLGRDNGFKKEEPKQSTSNELLTQYQAAREKIENIKKKAQQEVQNKRKNK